MSRKLLMPGALIRDTHTIVRHLGSGAFGDVYLSRHRYMGLQALKTFSLDDNSDALEEAYLLAKLGHRNIVRMFEANDFEHCGKQMGYFTMEYIEGGSLRGAAENQEIGTKDRIGIGKDILSGLAFAHAQQPPIIHRDISPSNILVQRTGHARTAKISDFGLAKHIDTESMIASAAGKYLYMAPESFLDIHSTATDVYAASVVLFELFTGTHPFKFSLSSTATPKEVAEVVRQSRQSDIPAVINFNGDLSASWDGFFRAALAHDYEARPKDAGALLRFYEETLAAEPAELPLPSELVGLIDRAMFLSQQAVTLDEAIQALDEACASPAVRFKYGDLLSQWKAGIMG